MGYIHDEALRIVSVTLMYEGHTYQFRVYNTAGMFTVYLEKHIFRRVTADTYASILPTTPFLVANAISKMPPTSQSKNIRKGSTT